MKYKRTGIALNGWGLWALSVFLLFNVSSCNILFNILGRGSSGTTAPALIAKIYVDNTSIVLGGTFTLDASGSTVPVGPLPSYQWTLIERPRYSVAVLENSSEIIACLIPDKVGSYCLSLTVSSGASSNSISIVLRVTGEATLAVSTTGLSLNVGSISEFNVLAKAPSGDVEPLSSIHVLDTTLASAKSIYQDGQTTVFVTALKKGSTSIVITSASGKQKVVFVYIQDPPVAGEASLLLAQDIVNLYVDAVIHVAVWARNSGGSIESVSITIPSDSTIASTSVSNTVQGSIVTITGKGFGSTNLRVTSVSGKSGFISIWVKSEEMDETGLTIVVD